MEHSILSINPQFAVQGYKDTLSISYIDNVGNVSAKSFTGEDATNLNNLLNTMDFTSVSLRMAALQLLVTQGVFPPANVVSQ